MPSSGAASTLGGARASVASLEGLRNVLRNNESERDSASIRAAGGGPVTTPVVTTPVVTTPVVTPPVSPAPADDKQTLRALNDRLSGYLGRVKQLEKENQQLKEEMEEIWGERRTAEGRDWGALEKPLNHLKNKIKEATMHNAKLLLRIDNTKLANADFMNKLNDETKARKAIENDLDDLKKNIEDTELSNRQTRKEIQLVKDELAIFEQDHKNVVDDLCEKIKNSEINVEIETPNSNLPEIVSNIRKQYDKLATKNLKETEDWYQSKFENIKVEEARSAQALQSGKLELQDLLKQKQHLEVKVQGARSTIFNLEESSRFTKLENGRRLGPLNRTILDLEQQLRKMRAHVENQLEMNKDLLCVKMKLESEIDNYQQLMSDNFDRADFSLDHGLAHDQQKPDGEEHEVMKEENEAAPSEAPQIKEEVWTEPTDDLAVRQNAKITKSSSSESEEEKARNQGEEEKARSNGVAASAN